MAVLVFLSSQSHTRQSESEHSRWMTSSQKGAFVPHLQSLTVTVKLSLPSTSLGLFAWQTLVLISKGHSRGLLNQDLFHSKWPHWWPTIASHKEKLEAAIDTNGDQFFTERFTVTTIYPCLQWSYKQTKRNILFTIWTSYPFFSCYL